MAEEKARTGTDSAVILGNYGATIDPLQLFPVAISGNFKAIDIAEDFWVDIENALGKSLDDHHRRWINLSVSNFVFCCVYKKQLPSHRQYIGSLDRRVDRVLNTLNKLLEQIALPEDAVDRERQLFRFPDRIFTTAQDHLQIIGSTAWSDSTASLNELHDRLTTLKSNIARIDRKSSGRDKHYELDFLILNIAHIAHSLGVNLVVTSNELRNNNNDEDLTPLVHFVEIVAQWLRVNHLGQVALYKLDPDEASDAAKTIKQQVDQKTGSLLERIRSATSEVGLSQKKIDVAT